MHAINCTVHTARHDHDGNRVKVDAVLVSTQPKGRRWLAVGRGISGYSAMRITDMPPFNLMRNTDGTVPEQPFEIVLNAGHIAIAGDSPQAAWSAELLDALLRNAKPTQPLFTGLSSLSEALAVCNVLCATLDTAFLKMTLDEGVSEAQFLTALYASKRNVRNFMEEADVEQVCEILRIGTAEDMTIAGRPCFQMRMMLHRATVSGFSYRHCAEGITPSTAGFGLCVFPYTVEKFAGDGAPTGAPVVQTFELVPAKDPDASMLLFHDDPLLLLGIAAELATRSSVSSTGTVSYRATPRDFSKGEMDVFFKEPAFGIHMRKAIAQTACDMTREQRATLFHGDELKMVDGAIASMTKANVTDYVPLDKVRKPRESELDVPQAFMGLVGSAQAAGKSLNTLSDAFAAMPPAIEKSASLLKRLSMIGKGQKP